jgi:hypothetical protein
MNYGELEKHVLEILKLDSLSSLVEIFMIQLAKINSGAICFTELIFGFLIFLRFERGKKIFLC